MAAYLETLITDVRAGVLAGAPDLTANGVYEAEHAEIIPWGELPLPFGVIAIELDGDPEWGIRSTAFLATIDVYLVYSELGGSDGVRAKLEAVRDAFAGTERLTQGTTLEISGLSWSRNLEPNRELASDPSRRAGRVTIQAVVGERP